MRERGRLLRGKKNCQAAAFSLKVRLGAGEWWVVGNSMVWWPEIAGDRDGAMVVAGWWLKKGIGVEAGRRGIRGILVILGIN